MSDCFFCGKSHTHLSSKLLPSSALLCAYITTLVSAWNPKGTGTTMLMVGTMLAPVEMTTNWEEPSRGAPTERRPMRVEHSSNIKWQHFSSLHTAWLSSGLQNGVFAWIRCETISDIAGVLNRGGCYQLEDLGVITAARRCQEGITALM